LKIDEPFIETKQIRKIVHNNKNEKQKVIFLSKYGRK